MPKSKKERVPGATPVSKYAQKRAAVQAGLRKPFDHPDRKSFSGSTVHSFVTNASPTNEKIVEATMVSCTEHVSYFQTEAKENVHLGKRVHTASGLGDRITRGVKIRCKVTLHKGGQFYRVDHIFSIVPS